MPVSIQGKPYHTVAERVKVAQETDLSLSCSITTSIESIHEREGGLREVLVKATVVFVQDDEVFTFTGHACEQEAPVGSKSVNVTSFIENAETSAVGRALAFAGLAGEQIASADEVNSAINQEADMVAHKEAKDGAARALNAVLSVLEPRGITSPIFWDAFQKRIGKTDSSKVTLAEWKQVKQDLQPNNLAGWVLELKPPQSE